MKNEQYINIQGWMINKLELKGTDLIIYAIIYGFSQDGESKYEGSLKYLQKATNSSKPTVIKSLKFLIEKDYITKEVLNYNNINFNKYHANLQVVKKLYLGVVKKLYLGVVKKLYPIILILII